MVRFNHIFALAMALSTGTVMAKDIKKVKKSVESDDPSGDDSGGKKYSAPYGMAGCGLWSQILKGDSRDRQLAVSVLRMAPVIGSSDSQTSAITSGTSNCVQSRSSIEEVEQRTYMTINLASLTKESAQGEGQHLEALAEIFGCPHAEFAEFSQRRYGDIYNDQNPDKVLANYIREVQSEKSLGETCQRVG